MLLLNDTLGGSDLLCRLATHKTGRVWTENPYTMLSTHLKAIVQIPIPDKPKRLVDGGEGSTAGDGVSVQRRDTQDAAMAVATTGFEYNIFCPASLGKPQTGSVSLEGLSNLAIIKDCSWCRKAADELLGMCGPTKPSADAVRRDVSWVFGGARCEGC
jgi:hypothetical protein